MTAAASRRGGRTAQRPIALIVTCEHGGNAVPDRYRGLFDAHSRLLDSHRGLDVGSLPMARELARAFDAPLIATTTTRLLVDLNRSIGHARLWSPVTRRLPPRERETILAEYYRPYRATVEAAIRQMIAAGSRVLHVSSHSFTPRLDGSDRRADVGLLYDPARAWERSLCARWRAALLAQEPALGVRRNYPYLGTADGLTTALRRRFAPSRYAGIELEINQRYPLGEPGGWRRLRRQVTAGLAAAID